MNLRIVDLSLKIGRLSILQGISLFPISTGEIHGIVGGNGSGKSTLLSMLAGYLPSGAEVDGSLELDGKDVLEIYDRRIALLAKIYLVPQEPPVISALSALDNLFLGNETATSWRRLARDRERKRASGLLLELGWDLDLEGPAYELSVAERQKLAILRVLLRDPNPNFLLLDEPTTQLSEKERASLLEMLGQLALRGTGIVLVSHKPADIMKICQRISVIRSGRVDATFDSSDLSKAELSLEAFGSPDSSENVVVASRGNEVLSIDLGGGDCCGALKFVVYSGEIVGIFEGEQFEKGWLFDVLSHKHLPFPGSMILGGVDVTSAKVSDLRKRGFSFVPALKMELGLFPDLSAQENLLLLPGTFGGIWIWSTGAEQRAAEMGVALQIPRSRLSEPVKNFSGGYKQRIMLAREINCSRDFIMFENPSQGLDVNTLTYLNGLLRKFTQAGGAGILISSDRGELERMSSRVLPEVQES